MTDLSDRLKEARLHVGLTQAQLAEKTGISLRTVKQYEKDASAAKVNSVQKIASACNVDAGWLFTGNGAMCAQPHITEAEKNKRIVVEHQDIIKQFNEPERGLRINKSLIRLQNSKESLLDQVESFIAGLEAATDESNAEKSLKKTRKIRRGPVEIQPSDKKNRANGK